MKRSPDWPVASVDSNEVVMMFAVSVRDLDETALERLRVRATQHGRSIKAEIRALLTNAVTTPADPRGLAQTILGQLILDQSSTGLAAD